MAPSVPQVAPVKLRVGISSIRISADTELEAGTILVLVIIQITSILTCFMLCRNLVLPHLARRSITLMTACLRAWRKLSIQSQSWRRSTDRIRENTAKRILSQACLAWQNWARRKSRLRAGVRSMQSRYTYTRVCGLKNIARSRIPTTESALLIC